jgi:ribosomal protein L11 methyltransferase
LDKTYPALDVQCEDADLLLAVLDDYQPTAVEEHTGSVRVFFARSADREAARVGLESRYRVEPLDVPDEDWGRRSQENLQPITIGRLTVFPNPEARSPKPCSIVIRPSMGFGTGHHATTQLCLEALQTLDLTGAHVLDVGTGSGVLAIAAVRLGAARAVGIDVDEDAIDAARENLTVNPDVAARVSFELGDVSSLNASLGVVPNVVTANLTGATLVRSASTLVAAVRAGGMLILSGLQVHELDAVRDAFGATSTVWERTVDDWVGLAVKKA